MRIGCRDTSEGVLVVAEIGNNHEGSLERARRMVREAAAAGADAVKFQTFRVELFASPLDAARFARLHSFELPPAAFAELAAVAREEGVLFISTPLDLPSVDVLAPIAAALKVASGDNDFEPLLARVAGTGLPVLLSTGLADLATVDRAVRCLSAHGAWPAGERVALLHCVSSYPVPAEEANLLAIGSLRRRYGLTAGYSDHCLGTAAVLASVALGARIVEKHFTLDKGLSDFRDHRLSADPAELRQMVRAIRDLEAMLGDGHKRVMPCEEGNRVAMRRSIAASGDLPAGHLVRAEDVVWLRPGGGLSPGEEAGVIGARLARPMVAGTPFEAGQELLERCA
ncbi:MAG: N-acetylneuraminate synthase family protein [Chthonomonadales bacterium]|nr:N-acetylneuraminate synthase family protein [Chthonomonadales bacterium]